MTREQTFIQFIRYGVKPSDSCFETTVMQFLFSKNPEGKCFAKQVKGNDQDRWSSSFSVASSSMFRFGTTLSRGSRCRHVWSSVGWARHSKVQNSRISLLCPWMLSLHLVQIIQLSRHVWRTRHLWDKQQRRECWGGLRPWTWKFIRANDENTGELEL